MTMIDDDKEDDADDDNNNNNDYNSIWKRQRQHIKYDDDDTKLLVSKLVLPKIFS